MQKEIIFTQQAPAPIGPYSQAVRAGNTTYFSGTIALNPQTSAMVGNTAAEQTEQIMQNISQLLNAAGLGFENIVKTSIFLHNMDDFAQVNQVYASRFTSNFPARETVQVSRLPKDALVEISIIACN